MSLANVVPGLLAAIHYNTLVVASAMAAVGFAAGMVGSFAMLRRRALVGDAAAHASLAGVAAAFLLTGRRDLPTLLLGALAAAAAGMATLVVIRRCTRTRDDAATALVIGVSFGLGIMLVSGIPRWGYAGSAGLEQMLLGHTAAGTAVVAALLAAVSAAAVLVVVCFRKEATLVAFDAPFAAAAGWPVTAIEVALLGLVAEMVVVGLPAAGAVLVTALLVIPPVAARQWTERVGPLLLLAGMIGLVAALAGVAVTAAVPRLPTGPIVVLATAAICFLSLLFAPGRGLVARMIERAAVARRAARGMLLDGCRRAAGDTGDAHFDTAVVMAAVFGDDAAAARVARRAWGELVRHALVAPAARGAAAPSGDWLLTPAGRAAAGERDRRRAAWLRLLETAPDEVRRSLTIDLPDLGRQIP
ncbi:MAG: metal ABC transporter permease [Planctomycetia bacterium]